MLIVPASKVFAPPTVVMRIWVSVSDKVLAPLPEKIPVNPVSEMCEEPHQVLDPNNEIVAIPLCMSAAAISLINKNPVVGYCAVAVVDGPDLRSAPP
jgi:hypothetical protein